MGYNQTSAELRRETAMASGQYKYDNPEDAYLEALRRIEQAAKENATKLDLGGLGLAELPSEIDQLTKLQLLDLRANQLSSLPTQIGSLTNLKALGLGSNQITNLPPEIDQLTNLKSLALPNNHLVSMPEEISLLTNLKELHLNNNQLISLPAEIGQLSKLQVLNLYRNQLTNLDPEIGQLTNLQSFELEDNELTNLPAEIGLLAQLQTLSVHNNQLSHLPPEIGLLTQLQALRLPNNHLTSLPPEIGQLTNLQTLNLWDNQLTNLPPQIGQLTNLKILYLHNNMIASLPAELRSLEYLLVLHLSSNPLSIPPELLDEIGNPQAILTYYFETHEAKKMGETRALMETKVAFVGEAEVGKTSLIKGLVGEPFDLNEPMTHDIRINHRDIETSIGEVHLRLWDFGGQQIMHPTHQFFLTERTLYVLVFTTRQSDAQNQLKYWLDIIASFGGDAPIILVGNKVDEHPLDIDDRGLMRKYPNIKAVIGVSAATGEGMEDLETQIAAHIPTLEHIEDLLPNSWFAVKEELEEQAQEQNYVPYEEYIALCEQHSVHDEASQKTLIGYLHSLGIVLNYTGDLDDALPSTHILNPEWVTAGVYAIINDPELVGQGMLDWDTLRRILSPPEFPTDVERRAILEMMRKFELTFRVDESGIEKFLVPNLLPKNEPAILGEWGDSLGFVYQYEDVLPTSLMARFIVRMQDYLYKGTAWRTGVVLEKGKNQGLVISDPDEHNIRIQVKGKEETRRDFMAAIRHEIEAVNRSVSQLKATPLVPVPGTKIMVSLDHLLKLEWLGEATFLPDGLDKKYSVRKLLSGYETARDGFEKGIAEGFGNISEEIEEMRQGFREDVRAELEPLKEASMSKTEEAPKSRDSILRVILLFGMIAGMAYLFSSIQLSGFAIAGIVLLALIFAVVILSPPEVLKSGDISKILGGIPDALASIFGKGNPGGSKTSSPSSNKPKRHPKDPPDQIT